MSLPYNDPALLRGYAQGYGARKGYNTAECDRLAKNFLTLDTFSAFRGGGFGMVTTALECYIDGHFTLNKETETPPDLPKEDTWVDYVRKR